MPSAVLLPDTNGGPKSILKTSIDNLPTNRPTMTTENLNVTPDDLAAVDRCKAAYDRIRTELAKVIVGQSEVIEQVLIAIFARGHALLEGVPGLAKTLLDQLAGRGHAPVVQAHPVHARPDAQRRHRHARSSRKTCRPAPREYKFLPGPLFANMILADEINRTPPKTQAAMLEAMQERQISAGGQVHKLPDPFFVLATQNPLEQEGTYPLPEAQLDRFLLYIKVGLSQRGRGMGHRPPRHHRPAGQDHAVSRGRRHHRASEAGAPRAGQRPGAGLCLGPGPRHAAGHARGRRLRQPWVTWGAGPRGLLTLVTCAKARAILYGRYHATVGDVQAWPSRPCGTASPATTPPRPPIVDSDQLIDMLDGSRSRPIEVRKTGGVRQ